VWSATSFQQLRADALRAERHNRLHPDDERWVPYVVRQLADTQGPIIAATDYLKAVPDMVARWIDRPYVVLGTDGFGRSDTRDALRTYFEVSPEHIAYAALTGLGQTGEASADELVKARTALGIDLTRPDPSAVEPTAAAPVASEVSAEASE
jgi:pyruvate dehydrogenase E1 component